MSRPVWGGWIEIFCAIRGGALATQSRPVWGGWIEIKGCNSIGLTCKSRPVWGGWIEIFVPVIASSPGIVPSSMGRVD